MASLCLDTEPEALCKIFCDGAHLFFGYFVPLLKKEASQSLQISVRFWTCSGLQNRPNTVVHWIKVRAVGRPFLGSDEIRKMCWNPVLSFSSLVCRSRILLKGPVAFKMLLGPWQYNGLQNITLIDISINLDTGFDKNQRSFARCTDSSPYHRRVGDEEASRRQHPSEGAAKPRLPAPHLQVGHFHPWLIEFPPRILPILLVTQFLCQIKTTVARKRPTLLVYNWWYFLKGLVSWDLLPPPFYDYFYNFWDT